MIGKVIKDIRKQQLMNQMEFAQRAGVSQSTVSRWERDSDPVPVNRQEELADALGVSVEELGADPQAVEEARGQRSDGYVRTSGEVNAWRDKLGVTPMNMYVRLILAILPSFRTEEGVVLVTRQQLIDDANLPGELVDEHWPAVLESEWVERVGEVEWAFRLVMPEG